MIGYDAISASFPSQVWHALVGHGVAEGALAGTGKHHAEPMRSDNPGVFPDDR